MDWLESKLEKWALNIERHSNKETAERVMQGSGALREMDSSSRAHWFAESLRRLEAEINGMETRQEILTACSCTFTDEFGPDSLLPYRKIFEETGDVRMVLEAMQKDRSRFATSELKGNVIHEKRAPRDPEAYAKAGTAEERRLAACFCPLARAGQVPFPEPYCYCSAGWFKGIWEGIIGSPVRVEVTKSLLRGDETCEFEIHLPQEIPQ